MIFVGFVALLLVVGTTHADRSCSDNLDQREYVVKGYFARKLNDCFQGYHCSNGQPVALPNKCGNSSYFSLEEGTCAFNASMQRQNYYGTSDCASETEKYRDNKLRDLRKRTCDTFKREKASDAYLIYAGDPDNCKMMFNCRVDEDAERYFNCPGPLGFDDTLGMCTATARCLSN